MTIAGLHPSTLFDSTARELLEVSNESLSLRCHNKVTLTMVWRLNWRFQLAFLIWNGKQNGGKSNFKHFNKHFRSEIQSLQQRVGGVRLHKVLRTSDLRGEFLSIE